jgi:hypothetical protein
MSSVFENSLSECEINLILYELPMCKVSLKNVFLKSVKVFGNNVGAIFSANKLCIYILFTEWIYDLVK